MEKGWVKLHRRMLNWEWYDDPITFKVFTHLLLTVNYERKKWHGVWIERGQIVTSRDHLAEQMGLGVQSIRTALTKLKSTSTLTIKTTNKYTIITIPKWNEYQQVTSKLTNEQPTTNQQLTTTKEYKEYKKNTPAKAGPKMDIDYNTGEEIPQKQKAHKRDDVIKLALLFDKMASQFSERKIVTPRSYFIVLNAMNTHGLKPKGVVKIYEDWFNNDKIKMADKVKMSWCLGKDNINTFKVNN